MNLLGTHLIHSKFVGTLSYDEGLRLQARSLVELEAQNAPAAVLLGLDHLPVATLGVRGEVDKDLSVSQEQLRLKGLELALTGRGGQATVHSPGQLVIYPCVNLRVLGLGAREFVAMIERTTSEWLDSLAIKTESDSREPGLFVDGAKLVAFGFKISRGLTSHGLAINVENDLGLFELIRTCGVSSQRMTRLKDHGVSKGLEALFLGWSEAFKCQVLARSSPMLTEVGSGH